MIIKPFEKLRLYISGLYLSRKLVNKAFHLYSNSLTRLSSTICYEHGEALTGLSICLEGMGEHNRALERANNAVSVYNQLRPSLRRDEHLFNVYELMCLSCSRLQQFSDAIVYTHKILEILNNARAYKTIFHYIHYLNMVNKFFKYLLIIFQENTYHPHKMLELIFEIQNNAMPGTLPYSQVLYYKSKFLHQVGSYDSALKCANECLRICLKLFGEKSEYVVETRILLAELLLYQPITLENIQYAFENIDLALEVLRASRFKQKNAHLADALFCCSELYIAVNKPDDALIYVQKALDILGLTKDNDDPEVFTKLSVFVSAYCLKGQYKVAFGYITSILEICKRKIGNNVVYILDCYSNLIAIAFMLNDQQSIIKYTKELMAMWPRVLSEIARIPHEDLRLSYFQTVLYNTKFIISSAFIDCSSFEPTVCYDFVLKSTHIDAELNYEYGRLAQNTDNISLAEAKDRINELENEIKRLSANKESDPFQYSVKKAELESAIGRMMQLYDGVHIDHIFDTINTADVQNTLNEGEVLLEYGTFYRYISIHGNDPKFHTFYYAFVLTCNSIDLYFLSNAEEINESVNKVISAIESINDITQFVKKAHDDLIAPFEPKVQNASTIYVVPDNELYRLPFELLFPKGDGKDIPVVYLSSGRELLRNGKIPDKNGAVIIANPEYSLPGVSPLYFTEVEAQKVSSYFNGNAKVITGKDATKKALLDNDTNADILHISTHGYYDSQIVNTQTLLASAFSEATFHYTSGLILAGEDDSGTGLTDGILYSKEVQNMNLSRYRLAVLAACKTARGIINMGEGIKGLRHSFEMAGVDSLICTLWNVNDFASAVLMDKFYDEFVNNSSTLPSEALVKAKQYVKNVTAGQLTALGWENFIRYCIDSLLENGQDNSANSMQDILDKLSDPDYKPFTHPFYWAGFIFQGHYGDTTNR